MARNDRSFYRPFHDKVVHVLEKSDYVRPERNLGKDPESGLPVFVRMARFGAVAQIGETASKDKPRYAQLRKGQNMESITLDEALSLFKLPRVVGTLDGQELIASVGRFGPYIRHNGKFYSMNKKIDDPYTVDLERAIEIIREKQEKEKGRMVKTFPNVDDLSVLSGRWGVYIKYKGKNYKIPKGVEASGLSSEDCMKIIKGSAETKKSKK